MHFFNPTVSSVQKSIHVLQSAELRDHRTWIGTHFTHTHSGLKMEKYIYLKNKNQSLLQFFLHLIVLWDCFVQKFFKKNLPSSNCTFIRILARGAAWSAAAGWWRLREGGWYLGSRLPFHWFCYHLQMHSSSSSGSILRGYISSARDLQKNCIEKSRPFLIQILIICCRVQTNGIDRFY